MTRRLVHAIADQAMISAFNFGLNITLIKLWTPEDFGVFTIVSAVSLFAVMIQNAVINTPLAVHLPIALNETEKALLRRTFSTANLLLTLLVLVFSLGGLALCLGLAQESLILSASLYIVSQFVREYYRGLLAVEGQLVALLLADTAYVALASAALIVLHEDDAVRWQSLSTFLLILSIAGMLSMFWHLLTEDRPALKDFPGEMDAVFRPQIHEIRWSLLGAITTDILNRGYVYVAAVFFGPATVAQLQAGRILFGPLGLLTVAWSRIARPQLARLSGLGDTLRFNALLRMALCSFVLFNILFLAILWAAWPYLSATLFGDKYQGLGFLVAGWGVANVVIQVRSCLGVGAQALRQFRKLTLATIYGALISALIVMLACLLGQSAWLLVSVIGGESLAILLVARILHCSVSRMDMQYS